MNKEVKRSTLEVLKDLVVILVKVKLGLYSKSPLSAATDLKDVVDDVRELKTDIQDAKKDSQNEIPK